ncbi:MAG TPA: phytoene desaturase family protein [Chitinophagaceae bacterium]
MANVSVIGSGFAGLSAAACLAAQGHCVNVYEKNATPGGRARTFSSNGYLFDMGPSWYWMPGVFERFFNEFGYQVPELYQLQLLDPAFEMVFGDEDKLTVPAEYSELRALFESVEKGAASRLDRFMKEAAFKYELGIERLVYKPGLSVFEFADTSLIKGLFRLQVFSSFSRHVNAHFTDPRLRALMEFPVLFLGASPSQTPALYSLMNYAGLKLGTWYPKGGFGKLVEAMTRVASEQGANFHFNSPVQEITASGSLASGLVVDGRKISTDAVVATADYHHVESSLLPGEYRNYGSQYWQKKTFAPSCLVFYVGLNKKIDRLRHHTLFFDEDLAEHTRQIYHEPGWPAKPLFYVCCPSRTDASVAPEGHENLFFLIPIAPGLDDNQETREEYFRVMLHRLEKHTGEKDLASHIDFRRGYCVSDFIQDYNAYKGNAYGLANTLRQTAMMKPKITNRRIRNLFYAGQLTVPGPGVPPSIISGKLAAEQIQKYFKRVNNEVVI